MSIVEFEDCVVSTRVKTTNPSTLMHANWWTAMPALPASSAEEGYRRLWRQFADHTMNTWTIGADGTIKPGGRGFYVERREDHLVRAFFENFSLFPSGTWLQRICGIAGIPTGSIERWAWSYSYEEVLPGERRPRIADVTIMSRDEFGKGVVVIEAKKPGYSFASFAEKDNPQSGYYLEYAAMCNIGRKHQLLLIDEGDRSRLGSELRDSPSVVTWQALAKIALDLVEDLPIEANTLELLHYRLAAHYGSLGLLPEEPVEATGDTMSYARFRSLSVPKQLVDWLVGSEMFFALRQNEAVVGAPYQWLRLELSAADWRSRRLQTTVDRCQAIWRF